MIQPDGLLDHARRLAGEGRGRPPDADLRRGISAAYYAVFHDVTERAARHLIGSSPAAARNAIRRAWSHGEVAALAASVVDRAKVLAANPAAPMPKDLRKWGPLIDIAAVDASLVEALRLFIELQALRHRADYDHDATFDKLSLLNTCQDADLARARLGNATAAGSEAFFTLLTVRREDFQAR
jgi:hypothetical protein